MFAGFSCYICGVCFDWKRIKCRKSLCCYFTVQYFAISYDNSPNDSHSYHRGKCKYIVMYARIAVRILLLLRAVPLQFSLKYHSTLPSQRGKFSVSFHQNFELSSKIRYETNSFISIVKTDYSFLKEQSRRLIRLISTELCTLFLLLKHCFSKTQSVAYINYYIRDFALFYSMFEISFSFCCSAMFLLKD